MGKASHKHSKKYDDEERSQRFHKGAKHSRNVPGKGMRVINGYYDDEDDEDDDAYFDAELGVSAEASIAHTKG